MRIEIEKEKRKGSVKRLRKRKNTEIEIGQDLGEDRDHGLGQEDGPMKDLAGITIEARTRGLEVDPDLKLRLMKPEIMEMQVLMRERTTVEMNQQNWIAILLILNIIRKC